MQETNEFKNYLLRLVCVEAEIAVAAAVGKHAREKALNFFLQIEALRTVHALASTLWAAELVLINHLLGRDALNGCHAKMLAADVHAVDCSLSSV
jgi:hypothetical protein